MHHHLRQIYKYFRVSESYAYYGLTFGVKNLAGNLYLNMAILSLIEVSALFVGMYCVNR